MGTRTSGLRKSWNVVLRGALGMMPRAQRFGLYRRMVDCDPEPDARLVVKIAETQEELAGCFSLLHDAYVASGFMKPHPSGMRVTPYHALPTTTTICAKWDDQVVGTISMVREGVFGFPMQQAFDLTEVRELGGHIAEVSALAVHPDFRRTGGTILFPLMKYMYEYSTRFFDTRHLVIAVHPSRIELYESLLFFRRLTANVVDEYDFANGAPAVGATLDLQGAPEQFRRAYRGKPRRKDLLRYFTETPLPHLRFPDRPYYTTNDPVLTPELLDHFFNREVEVLQHLSNRQMHLLQGIYDLPEFQAVLPEPDAPVTQHPLRRHQRYSIRLPAFAHVPEGDLELDIIEVSRHGCQAETTHPLPLDEPLDVDATLGAGVRSHVKAVAVHRHDLGSRLVYGFSIDSPDAPWEMCVRSLERGVTHADLKST